MEKDNIHAGHRARLRQQMREADMSKMPEHMVLEYMLSFALPYKDVNPISHALINKFGNLSAVLDASMADLKSVDGISDVSAHYLKMCASLPKIVSLSRGKQKIKSVTNMAQSVDFLREHIAITDKEEFYYITTDTQYNILKFESLGYGSAYDAHVDIRELVRKLSEPTTSNVLICHTHPHGNPIPSKDDISFTRALNNALSSIGIKLSDHVVLAPSGIYSFFREGLLEKL